MLCLTNKIRISIETALAMIQLATVNANREDWMCERNGNEEMILKQNTQNTIQAYKLMNI